MTKLNKAQLVEALQSAGVDVPDTASLAQLRALYESTVTVAPQQPSGELTEKTPPSAELTEETPPSASPNGENTSETLAASDNRHSNTASDVQDLEEEQELARLERRKKILELRKELDQMEAPTTSSVAPWRAVDFSDIENAVPAFNGDDPYSITKWIVDYEDVTDSLGCDDRCKYLSARRLMQGTAKMLLRTVYVDNWDSLKQILIKEFDHKMSRQQVYRQLSERVRRQGEPLLRYVICMQELGSHAEIDEAELIEFIIDGLRDSPANVSILFAAKTIVELKNLLPRYEKRRVPRTMVARATTSGGNMVPSTSASNNEQSKRCFNCSKYGHIAAKCPKEQRPAGSCFKCADEGHTYKNCPYIVKTRVGAVNRDALHDDTKELTQSLDAVQMVSVAFMTNKNKCTKFIDCCSLLDTGSPISFIRKSVLPEEINVQESLTYSRFKGLGNIKLFTYGTINCYINIKDNLNLVSLMVIPDEVTPIPLLIGRDLLEIFNIKLNMNCNKVNITSEQCQNEICSNKVFLSNQLYMCTYSDEKTEPSECSHYKNNINDVFGSSVLAGELKIQPKELSDCFKDKLNTFDHDRIKLKDDLDVKREYNNVEVDSDLFGCHAFEIIWDRKDYIDIDSNLSLDISKTIKNIVSQNYLNFDKTMVSPKDFEMHIRLTSDIPVCFAPRRLSVSEKGTVSEIIKDLLEKRIIQPSSSPYAAPIVLVKKKSGETRMCIDYRALNKRTVRDPHPIPLIDDCIEYLEGKKVMTLLDLKSGLR